MPAAAAQMTKNVNNWSQPNRLTTMATTYAEMSCPSDPTPLTIPAARAACSPRTASTLAGPLISRSGP